jgi:predicted nucleotidyltransferase component of viral defense system
VGTVAVYHAPVSCYPCCHVAITGGDGMSEQGVYRVKAKALITVYRDVYALDIYDAIHLATERIDEWELYDWDEADIKRVLDVEYLRDE